MARTFVGGGTGIELVDDGSFARMLKAAPREMRRILSGEIRKTAFSLSRRMEAKAPFGPEAPHIRERVTFTVRGLSAKVGYIDATEPAGPGNTATIADVALFNEYTPNEQPFMRPAAEAEQSDFVKRMAEGLGQVERSLSGVGI